MTNARSSEVRQIAQVREPGRSANVADSGEHGQVSPSRRRNAITAAVPVPREQDSGLRCRQHRGKALPVPLPSQALQGQLPLLSAPTTIAPPPTPPFNTTQTLSFPSAPRRTALNLTCGAAHSSHLPLQTEGHLPVAPPIDLRCRPPSNRPAPFETAPPLFTVAPPLSRSPRPSVAQHCRRLRQRRGRPRPSVNTLDRLGTTATASQGHPCRLRAWRGGRVRHSDRAARNQLTNRPGRRTVRREDGATEARCYQKLYRAIENRQNRYRVQDEQEKRDK